MKQSKKRIPPTWSVVATAHTPKGLRDAARLPRGKGVDLVEVRLDCLEGRGSGLRDALAKIKLPLILTARHPREGGAGRLGDAGRAALLEAHLPSAAFVDVEIRSAARFRILLASAKRNGVGTILSFHDFKRTPPAARLRLKLREALRHGADIAKIAVTLRDVRDLSALMSFQAGCGKLATMGMGPLGKVSRLVLPLAGSRLVYGYLDRPQVDGQWPAEELAVRLAEVAP
jgi:3-dehydroquinate dehydratase I